MTDGMGVMACILNKLKPCESVIVNLKDHVHVIGSYGSARFWPNPT
jgi:hypothetical protein